MKKWIAALSLSLLAAPAAAHSYRVVLNSPSLLGHAGVQAVDHKTGTALVRVITPGFAVRKRGTVRVLVKNLGTAPFAFGPQHVTLQLADGTVLKPTPVEQFVKGQDLISRESSHAAVIDRLNRSALSAMPSQGGGMSAQSGPSGPPGPAFEVTSGHDWQTDESLLPGAKTLDAISQVLEPDTVAPQKAWGGYYVFDLPKEVFERRADQALTILVTTGGEQHRFDAVLKWK